MRIERIDSNLHIYGVGRLSLADTLDCGQAFRWAQNPDGTWQAIVHGRLLKVGGDGDEFILYDCDENEYNTVWRDYFDLGRDYEKIITDISKNDVLRSATELCGGIRLLRQDPWETLCSFIISQNNNIPRIKGIIDRLCENFGDKIDGGFAFPTADKIAGLSVDDLAPLRSGFRAKYILDAAQKVTSGEVDLNSLYSLDTDTARNELIRIKGVGAKVADCTLLFAFGKIDAFPKDVWIKRAMQVLFDGELPGEAVKYAGIVQQYIFHYARMTKLKID